MSCLYEMLGHFCSLHKIACTYPCEDFLTEEQVLVNNKHCDSYRIKETKQPYCKYCFNARVYKPTEEELMDPFATELTDENDFASRSIGHCHSKERRFMINSGNGHPVNIEFELLDNKTKEWHTVGKYYPKYCPECGRRLDEYEKTANHD